MEWGEALCPRSSAHPAPGLYSRPEERSSGSRSEGPTPPPPPPHPPPHPLCFLSAAPPPRRLAEELTRSRPSPEHPALPPARCGNTVEQQLGQQGFRAGQKGPLAPGRAPRGSRVLGSGPRYSRARLCRLFFFLIP